MLIHQILEGIGPAATATTSNDLVTENYDRSAGRFHGVNCTQIFAECDLANFRRLVGGYVHYSWYVCKTNFGKLHASGNKCGKSLQRYSLALMCLA